MINNCLQYLESNALKYGDKKALADESFSITYKEYMEKAKIIGSFIANKTNCTTNSPIAVLIDRNIASIVAFMGVVYSGNFYVPVDALMPKERVELIYKTLNPIMIIDARLKDEAAEGSQKYEDILNAGKADESILESIRDNAIDTDPLYTIFTSGSTGVPKGVCVCHRSMIDLVNSFEEAFNFKHETVFGNQAPFDFDVSAKDIYNALKVGGTVEVLPKKLFRMPKMLVDYLIERKITTLIWAVSALRIVSDFKTMEEGDVPKLENIMFSGEVMPVKALNYWMEKVPGARYVNLYGPTEITCNCTYYEINKHFNDDEMLPIGKAFKNTRVILKDENGKVIKEQGKVGEICVIGTCLALGYWNNKEKTDAAFILNPSISAYEQKMYATGDMGYYNVDGDIVFASRRDFQIKHMGHRIELGEIEVALNAIPQLDVSCCLYDKDNEKIVCFYQAKEECKKEIVTELSKKLPKFMWPNVYVHYEELPMNKNGKIDRVKLSETFKKAEDK